MRSRISIVAILICCSLFAAACDARAEESAAQRDQRMEWWREAKFGMFIHWGVYAVPAGTYEGKQIGGIGEWIQHQARIPVATYKDYAHQFNPVKFDPQAWAELAKDAGMRYMVITSKHHDGFALYDSAATDWDVVDATPYGKGLLAPLAAAARDAGLKFGLYYSQAQDWNHPGGAKAGLDEGDGWDPQHKGSFDDYLAEIAVPQTKEILEQFHPDVLWWDTPVWMTRERAQPLHELLALQPQIITNNRLGGGFAGDTETPEQHIPATGFADRDWETCMTLNDTWGYKSYDHNWKSTKTIITNLVDIVSKGGNYLLNVGPTAEGEIPQESIDRLHEVGAWMAVNGDAIYGTTASPCRKPAWGRLTHKGDRVFLHVFDWPQDGRLTLPLRVETSGCRLLADPDREFAVAQTEEGLEIHVTGDAVDPICTVIEMNIASEPQEVFQYVEPDATGALTLAAADAALTGGVQLESIGGQNNLGYWTDRGDSVAWRGVLTRGGAYDVIATTGSFAPATLQLSVGDSQAELHVAATGGYDRFAETQAGAIQIEQPGRYEITLQPAGDDWQPINLRSLKLVPTK